MARTSTPGNGTAPAPDTRVVPTAWFGALASLFAAPWIVVGFLYLRGTPAAPVVRQAAALDATPAAPGPWGDLTVRPIVISPPLEYVPADWGQGKPPRWHFPGVPADEVGTFLAGLGATPDQFAALQKAARPEPRIAGVVIDPPPAVVRSLSSDVRARLYTLLGKTPLNEDQAQAFRFLGGQPGDWFDGTMMSAQTRALVTPLLYRDGPFLHFADIEAIRRDIAGPLEMQYLGKALLRNATVLVELSVGSGSDVAGLAAYWGLGGRRTDIRPLLDSIAEAGSAGSIDIVHLLPGFARDHLYRYPKLTTRDLNRPLLANCLWSSLNFFARTPNDRFLDVTTALAALQNDYYIVEHGYQLGDIVALVDEQGNLFHAAVYIADGLVFTKNGYSPVSPWILMKLSDVAAFYRMKTESPQFIYHRLKAY